MHCSRPYQQFYVAENGDVHLCCPEWISVPAGNLLTTPPLEIWNGRIARKIRQSIRDQSFRYCTGCPFLPGPRGCVTDETPPAEDVVDRIDTLTMAYDPTCNLKCPSCRTAIRGKDPRTLLIHDIILTSGIFEHVDTLCSSGDGDPLASPLYWELLDKLPPSQYPRLRLILQTNGLLLDERAWERLGSNTSRILRILVSVDGACATSYRQNRGGDFSTLLVNLAGIQRRQIPLQVNMVVQANNFREMRDFVLLADAFGAYKVYFSTLENWGTYSQDEYLKRAVHLPSHPEHQQLLQILQDPLLAPSSKITLARLPRT